jgi:hypothetical protein
MLVTTRATSRQAFGCAQGRSITYTCAVAIVGLFGLVANAACNSVTISEVTHAACTDEARADEDNDGLANCDDPDCFGFEECRRSRMSNEAGSTGGDSAQLPTSGSAGSATAGTSALPPIAGAGAPAERPDAAVDEDDAGEEMPMGGDGDVEPTEPCGACAPTEMCLNDECVPIPKPAPQEGAFTLYLLSATAPVQTPLTTNCYDIACPSGRSLPYGICTCPPDPYVRIVIERGARRLKVGETEVAENTTEGEYVASFDIEVEPGDVIRFDVFDEDEPFTDELMYSCTPNLAELAEGPLDCATGAGFLGADKQLIRAELVARLE